MILVHNALTTHPRPQVHPSSPAPVASLDMRATFSISPASASASASAPASPSRELNASTPRPHGEPLASNRRSSRTSTPDPPVIYDSASQPLSTLLVQTPPSRESIRGFGAPVHDLYSPTARSSDALSDPSFQNNPDFFDRLSVREPIHPGLADVDPSGAAEPLPLLNMSDQRSDAGKNTTSRGRSRSNTSRRGQSSSRQQPSQPFQPHVGVGPYPSLQEQQQQQSFHGHARYPSPTAPYAQRGPAYISGQYAMTPPLSAGAQYAYPSHPGLLAHAPDAGSMHPQNQLMGYSTNTTLMPMMPPSHSHYSAFPAGDGGPSASSPHPHAYVSTAGATQTLYSPAHTSPTSHSHSHSPIGSSQATGMAQTYGTHAQSPYAPRFPTPSFMYTPPPPFTHSSALYQPQFSFGQTYTPTVSVPAEPDAGRSQGMWWYLAPGTRPAPSPHYDAYVSVSPYAMFNTVPDPVVSVEPYSQQGQQQQQQQQRPQLLTSLSVGSNPASSDSPRVPPPLPAFAFTSISSPSSAHQPEPPPQPLTHSLSEPARSEAPSTPSLAAMSRVGAGKRRPYHPNPPAQRSEWVMWAGNVPSDATHDELWRFFNSARSPSPRSAQHPSPAAPAASSSSAAPPAPTPSTPQPLHAGVSSIFLISRSNCAFVNFQSEAHLQAAIARFNGQPLRPFDPKCPRLVCRVRAREDDLKAGVGGQRGAGIHIRWVKEQQQKQQQQQQGRTGSPEAPISSSPGDTASMLASMSLSSGDESGGGGVSAAGVPLRRTKKAGAHSNSGESYASTTSSILSQYFPKRYFILKSLTQYDLDLSVEKCVWATQRHNEGVLDQAYRTSKEVYLIFGVNKSGEFYGYARMAGPILRARGEPDADRGSTPWAPRSSIESAPARRASANPAGAPSSPSSARNPQHFFSPEGQPYKDSPQPLVESPQAAMPEQKRHASAPGVMQDQHRPLSMFSAGKRRYGEFSQPPAAASVPLPTSDEDFHLDPKAPGRAARQRSGDIEADEMGVKRWDAARMSLVSVQEDGEPPAVHDTDDTHEDVQRLSEGDAPPPGGEDESTQKKDEGPVWGDSFQVEWIRTTRLPFYRTRNLRNPWNHDREVKVSRDGTELEPSVGQALLEEWDKPESEPTTQDPPRPGGRPPAEASAGKDAAPG